MPRHQHQETMPAQGWEGWNSFTTDEYSIAIYSSSNNYFNPGQVIHKAIVGSCGANTETTGSSASHNNMPPYLAVYVWKRTE